MPRSPDPGSPVRIEDVESDGEEEEETSLLASTVSSSFGQNGLRHMVIVSFCVFLVMLPLKAPLKITNIDTKTTLWKNASLDAWGRAALFCCTAVGAVVGVVFLHKMIDSRMDRSGILVSTIFVLISLIIVWVRKDSDVEVVVSTGLGGISSGMVLIIPGSLTNKIMYVDPDARLGLLAGIFYAFYHFSEVMTHILGENLDTSVFAGLCVASAVFGAGLVQCAGVRCTIGHAYNEDGELRRIWRNTWFLRLILVLFVFNGLQQRHYWDQYQHLTSERLSYVSSIFSAATAISCVLLGVLSECIPPGILVWVSTLCAVPTAVLLLLLPERSSFGTICLVTVPLAISNAGYTIEIFTILLKLTQGWPAVVKSFGIWVAVRSLTAAGAEMLAEYVSDGAMAWTLLAVAIAAGLSSTLMMVEWSGGERWYRMLPPIDFIDINKQPSGSLGGSTANRQAGRTSPTARGRFGSDLWTRFASL
eukprot:Sspe_Gene.101446::Locus_76040_Transcript_1_1_Confidence_1.000_Length_1479::g.101446::m.101446